MYIKSLKFTSDLEETSFLKKQLRTCYNGVYPYKIFPMKGLETIDFSPKRHHKKHLGKKSGNSLSRCADFRHFNVIFGTP